MALVTFEFPSKTDRIEFPAEVAQLVEQSSEELRTVSPCRGKLRPEIGATDWVGFFGWATPPATRAPAEITTSISRRTGAADSRSGDELCAATLGGSREWLPPFPILPTVTSGTVERRSLQVWPPLARRCWRSCSMFHSSIATSRRPGRT